MGVQLFVNNAGATLNGTLAVGGNTLNLASGQGSRFPTPTGGDYFLITLYEKDAGGDEINYEIVKCTARTADSLTITRDFEGIVVAAGGTSGGWAYPAAVGINPSQVVYVEMRETAYLFSNLVSKDEKDVSGGVPGLTLFKLNLRNAADTITSWLTNAATVARTWTFPDKDGTVAMLSDITLGALGAEAVANKATGFGTVNNTLYPTVQAVKTYADGLVAGLLDDRGNHDASGNAWPSSGGSGTAGAIMKGDFWYISVAGSLGGVSVAIGDSIRALTDTPGTTAANWSILEGNIGFTPENAAQKNASGGYAGLSGYKIQLRNDADTYTSLLQSTSTAARTWLFQDRSGTIADIDNAQTFTKAQRGAFVALTDAATVAVDLSLANVFNLVLGGNRTLGVPSNVVAGQQGVVNIYQDTTGSRSLAYSWCYSWAGGTAGTLSTAGCTRDMLAYSVDYYATGVFTTTIATPGVMTMASHGMISGQKWQATTTGALPTGLTASTTYYVHVIDANTFHLCTSLANVAAGTYIATSGSQSGVHTMVSCGITLALSKAIP
ncbi:MAG: hypothetical protein WAW73_17495 [Rhodoferax sp.]